MKLDVELHINDYVWVKLNDKGRDIHFHYFDCIPEQYRPVVIKPKVDDEGLTRFVFWEFIDMFSSHIGLGKSTPFDGPIKLDSNKET